LENAKAQHNFSLVEAAIHPELRKKIFLAASHVPP
jgi:hypothetical protein